MSKILAIVFLIAGFGIIMSYQNCGQPQAPKSNTAGSVTVSGTIEKSNLDGCNTLIISDEDPNSKFIPFGVNQNTLVDGDHVTITGHFPNDVFSSCMAGVILRVEKIEQTPASEKLSRRKGVSESQPFIP